MQQAKKILKCCLVALLFLAGAAQAKTAAEIRSFASDLIVNGDGTVSVQERIELAAPADEPGFVREIPTRRTDPDGTTRRVLISQVEVRGEDGRIWRHGLERRPDAVRIRIDARDLGPAGVRKFSLSYVASGALSHGAERDELRWLAAGAERGVPIRRVAATLQLPPAVPPVEIKLGCSTGAAAASDQACLFNLQGTRADYVANDALTITASWPAGFVAITPPPPTFYWSDLPYYWPLLLPLAVCYLLFWHWRKHQRGGK